MAGLDLEPGAADIAAAERLFDGVEPMLQVVSAHAAGVLAAIVENVARAAEAGDWAGVAAQVRRGRAVDARRAELLRAHPMRSLLPADDDAGDDYPMRSPLPASPGRFPTLSPTRSGPGRFLRMP